MLLSGAVYFTWGEIYCLFPATCTDSFGARYAATNAGLLYTAKGTAALLVPLTAYIAAKGDWSTVFWAGAIANVIAGVLAIAALKLCAPPRPNAVPRLPPPWHHRNFCGWPQFLRPGAWQECDA